MGETNYLGDGVYATFDGEYVWLTTQRASGLERIALDSAALNALFVFSKQRGFGNVAAIND